MSRASRDQDITPLVERLLHEEPALTSSLDFGPWVRQGAPETTRIIIGDQAAVALFAPEDAGAHEYRMALLARPGDTMVLRRRAPEFEDYLAAHLGLRNVTFLQASVTGRETVAQTCRTEACLAARLAAAAPAGAPLTLHAYLTTGHVWRLAQALGTARRAAIHVAGPGPRASRRANDKLWFWALAREVVGRAALPPTLHAFGPAAAVGQAARLAKAHDSIVLKIPDSAGGRGNLRFDSTSLRGKSLRDIRDLLQAALEAAGWRHSYPILVGVWETGVTSSPSAQMWLPLPAEGPPRLLGLFEQRVEGADGSFTGARPARLDPGLAAQMHAQALRIATVLQLLGYFGPCSLDAVCRQRTHGGQELHWIECNGRWSGVSIPLTAARMLLGGADPRGLVIVQEIIPRAPVVGTSALCQRLDGLLFRLGERREGLVLVSPPDTRRGLSFNAMAIAESQPRAEALMAEAYAKLRNPQ